jgi:hypothetical protein
MLIAADEVLALWERAAPLGPPDRAVMLAAALAPPHPVTEVRDWPIGSRDARLVRLQQALAGTAMAYTTSCDACGSDIEFDLDGAALLDTARAAEPPSPVEVDGWRITWRPIATTDLLEAARAGDLAAADAVLFDRCIERVTAPVGSRAGTSRPPVERVRREVVAAMAVSDPLAEVLVELTCPGCRAAVTAEVDVAELVWTELRSRALRLLREVDVLARAYGWTEPEVLALSAQRRRVYLQLVGSGAS